LLDLQPLWSGHDHFFVTEDTALGQSLRADHRTYLLPHFAWGQARLGAPLRMLATALISLFRSAALILRERPTTIISTGAGAVFFPVLWAKLMGARVIIIESFARFDRPSLFGRLAAPLADELIVQSEKLVSAYPNSRVFDPLRLLDEPAPPKEDLLFATVGATLPFDRLAHTVVDAKREGAISEEVVLQSGVGGLASNDVETRETIPFDEVKALLRRASIVVCHGGTGSLITALREGCHVIAMPRLAALGEHYDDHQAEITGAFAERGLIQVANSPEEFRRALAATRNRARLRATSEPAALIEHLREVIV
jgi:UDP-N-acetylglucosamine transferase subunit ALG13